MIRRWTAPAIALAGLAALWPAAHSVARLGEAREDRVEAQRALARAVRRLPPTPAPLRIGSDRGVAERQLAGLVRAEAQRGGLLVEQIAPLSPRQRWLVGVRLQLSGSEKAVLAAMAGLESDRPLSRLAEWRIEAQADDRVVLEATLIGAWQ